MPPWLGIDRALAGWAAWRHQQAQGGGAVLVADAGTALSLTWVDGSATFRGGRLQAGVGLQMRAMTEATTLLPPVALRERESGPDPWPKETSEAMRSGCLFGVAAAIAAAWGELARREPGGLWLTGGDGPLVQPLLAAQGIRFSLAPDLCLQALAALSADPGR
jgi:type III pantothenate kinase